MSGNVSFIPANGLRQHTGNNNIPVVGDKVLDNLGRTVHNVDVSPVDPRVVGLQGGREEIVARSAHCLSARALGLEAVTVLDILAQLEAKVLLDNQSAAELVRPLLEAVELRGERGKGLVGRVAHEETEINQVVRVRKLGDQLKILGEVPAGILERGENEDAFLVVDGVGSRLDGVQVDVLDRGRVYLYWVVRIVHDGGTKVRRPGGLFVERHLHWGF